MEHTSYIAESERLASTGATIQAAGPAVTSGEAFKKGTVVAYLVLGAIVALSSLLPWEKLLFVQASGLQVGRGWLVLLGGGLSVTTAGFSLANGRPVRGLRVSQFICAAAAITMFAAEYAALSNACSELTSGTDWLYGGSGSNDSTASCVGSFMGIGAPVALLSGIALALVTLLRKPSVSTS